MNTADYLKALGSRIMCELNDLKRTPEAAANDLGYDLPILNDILAGRASKDTAFGLIDRMGDKYPIDAAELKLLEDDTLNGAKFMRISDSRGTSRIYRRPDAQGGTSDYYEYWDTVMSRLSYFKPELIQQLRFVDDNDPENPDVRYNHGHFLHQYGIFVGEVNFYYEQNGRRYCESLNTGDSYYMTPFVPHTFTSRNREKPGYMIAVTSGGEVKRAQKELYALGEEALQKFSTVGQTKEQGFATIVRQHMEAEMLTEAALQSRLDKLPEQLNATSLLAGKTPSQLTELSEIAQCLNIDVGDLLWPSFAGERVAYTDRFDTVTSHPHPSQNNCHYQIYPLVRSPRILGIKGFILKVLKTQPTLDHPLHSSLHAYIINFGEVPVTITWENDGSEHQEDLYKHDSVYLKPFTSYGFNSEAPGSVFVVNIRGSMTLSAQKELAGFHAPERVIGELTTWFDEK